MSGECAEHLGWLCSGEGFLMLELESCSLGGTRESSNNS